jgi:hypothetical protein
MTSDQLRQALKELNGERSVAFAILGLAEPCVIHNAMLVPDEPDHLVKVTDGQGIFIIDAERVAFVRIGLNHELK